MKNPTHNQKAQVVAMFLSSSNHSLACKSEINVISKTIKEAAGASLKTITTDIQLPWYKYDIETITPDTSGVTTHLSHRLPMSNSSKLQIKLNIRVGFLDIPESKQHLVTSTWGLQGPSLHFTSFTKHKNNDKDLGQSRSSWRCHLPPRSSKTTVQHIVKPLASTNSRILDPGLTNWVDLSFSSIKEEPSWGLLTFHC